MFKSILIGAASVALGYTVAVAAQTAVGWTIYKIADAVAQRQMND